MLLCLGRCVQVACLLVSQITASSLDLFCPQKCPFLVSSVSRKHDLGVVFVREFMRELYVPILCEHNWERNGIIWSQFCKYE